jgi:hypothetical protein
VAARFGYADRAGDVAAVLDRLVELGLVDPAPA